MIITTGKAASRAFGRCAKVAQPFYGGNGPDDAQEKPVRNAQLARRISARMTCRAFGHWIPQWQVVREVLQMIENGMPASRILPAANIGRRFYDQVVHLKNEIQQGQG